MLNLLCVLQVILQCLVSGCHVLRGHTHKQKTKSVFLVINIMSSFVKKHLTITLTHWNQLFKVVMKLNEKVGWRERLILTSKIRLKPVYSLKWASTTSYHIQLLNSIKKCTILGWTFMLSRALSLIFTLCLDAWMMLAAFSTTTFASWQQRHCVLLGWHCRSPLLQIVSVQINSSCFTSKPFKQAKLARC